MTRSAAPADVPQFEAGALSVRTAAWYGDYSLTLPLPPSWRVRILGPKLPPPLTDAAIEDVLAAPTGQPPIAELCRGKRRPLVIVDDLNRPTPIDRVMPLLMHQFAAAGFRPEDIGIVLASGAHRPPTTAAIARKLGPAAAACKASGHDCHGDAVNLGRTSFGTPVLVDRRVAESDVVIGIGGMYPNDTSGFGGGSKLALGVLAERSIAALHFGHESMGWGTPNEHSHFRHDLDEIAGMIGLTTTISLLIDADRQIVAVAAGDHRQYYPPLVRLAREAFWAPRPDAGTDLVIANTYPNDVSLTFARSKGMKPLATAAPHASRIAIAACPEGLGYHGLFPFMNAPRFHRERLAIERARVLLRQPRVVAGKVQQHLVRHGKGQQLTAMNAPTPERPIWLYRPAVAGAVDLPAHIPGMHVSAAWDEIVAAVDREQGDRPTLQVAVYPCAPLQWLE